MDFLQTTWLSKSGTKLEHAAAIPDLYSAVFSPASCPGRIEEPARLAHVEPDIPRIAFVVVQFLDDGIRDDDAVIVKLEETVRIGDDDVRVDDESLCSCACCSHYCVVHKRFGCLPGDGTLPPFPFLLSGLSP